tara:strand:+ start:305 stop:607 length:303 start_codon:yes stop_codon:yes gene_type:complete
MVWLPEHIAEAHPAEEVKAARQIQLDRALELAGRIERFRSNAWWLALGGPPPPSVIATVREWVDSIRDGMDGMEAIASWEAQRAQLVAEAEGMTEAKTDE